MLILSNDLIEALKKAGVPPAQEIVVRHLIIFGLSRRPTQAY